MLWKPKHREFFFIWQDSPQWSKASSFTRFLDHTQGRTTVRRTPLDEWSACRRDLYLTTHDNHNRQTSVPPGGIRNHNPSKRAAADLGLGPRGHWGRHNIGNYTSKCIRAWDLSSSRRYDRVWVFWDVLLCRGLTDFPRTRRRYETRELRKSVLQ